jgi:ABC-type transport system substrate-binding protein
MAYMNQERKNKLAPGIKAALKKWGMKGTISVQNYSTLVVKITSGKIDFEAAAIKEKFAPGFNFTGFNVHGHWRGYNFSGDAADFLTELHKAMNTDGDTLGNHDNSDTMTDYFDVGWYTNVEIGDRYGKQYQVTA